MHKKRDKLDSAMRSIEENQQSPSGITARYSLFQSHPSSLQRQALVRP